VSDLSTAIARDFGSFYQDIGRRLHALVEPLSLEQLWQHPYPYGNSVGHLVLHLTGNLSYYIGAQIAETGYVRDRPKEFTDTEPRSKDELLAAFDEAIAMVVKTLERQSPTDWMAPYTADRQEPCDRFAMVLRCATHAQQHVGQMIYLCKQLAL
jgi:uncharacterized damage-inducible protein DinB